MVAFSKRLAGVARTWGMVDACSGGEQGPVGEQGPDRGEPGVTGTDRVAPAMLEIVEESQDRRGIHLGLVTTPVWFRDRGGT